MTLSFESPRGRISRLEREDSPNRITESHGGSPEQNKSGIEQIGHRTNRERKASGTEQIGNMGHR